MNTPLEAVIRVHNVAVLDTGSSRVLPAVEFSVRRAEVVALLGPDPQLLRKYLRSMAAIEIPYQGKVEVMGLSTEGLDRLATRKLRARIGYLIGESSLLPIYSGLMNVMLPALYHHPERQFSTVSRSARALLDELDCTFDIQSLPYLMSGIQQRQLQLARALILEPDILFMEEPFYDLTVDDKRVFAGNLSRMQERVQSRCIVLTTDYLEYVSRFVDRIVFLSHQLVEVFPDWRSLCVSRQSEIEQYLAANL